MDLAVESQRLRLDLLTVEVCATLARAGVQHVVIKGPTTSRWLYAPPRPYNDVDVLVPVSRLADAADALRAATLAVGSLGGVGLEGAHSHTLTAPSGFGIDLHTSLPCLPPREDDALWEVLAPCRTELDLGVGTVPALDEPARCLVVALHALSGGAWIDQRTEDLVRALAIAPVESWNRARTLARSLDALDLFDAGKRRAEFEPDTSSMSSRAYLHFTCASPEAMSLDRLLSTPWRQIPRIAWHELWPSRDFLAQAYPGPERGRLGLVLTRLRRLLRLAVRMPHLVRETLSARGART